MNFHEEIYAIHNNWVSQRLSKRNALIEFEAVMREHHLIPPDYILNPDLSDVEFISLLNHAFSLTEESLAWLEKEATSLFAEHYVTEFRCSVCNKWITGGLYKRIGIQEQDDGDQITPQEIFELPSPRCMTCAQAYMDEHIFKTKRSRVPDTGEAPMSLTEQRFFEQYEQQMKESNGKK